MISKMSGHMKFFDKGSKNMSFMINDNDVLEKYNNLG